MGLPRMDTTEALILFFSVFPRRSAGQLQARPHPSSIRLCPTPAQSPQDQSAHPPPTPRSASRPADSEPQSHPTDQTGGVRVARGLVTLPRGRAASLNLSFSHLCRGTKSTLAPQQGCAGLRRRLGAGSGAPPSACAWGPYPPNCCSLPGPRPQAGEGLDLL